MRNLSMKKFGTPSGTGPGSDNDVVGFVTVGRPWSLRSGGGVTFWAKRSGSTVCSGLASQGSATWAFVAPPPVSLAIASRPFASLLGVSHCGSSAGPAKPVSGMRALVLPSVASFGSGLAAVTPAVVVAGPEDGGCAVVVAGGAVVVAPAPSPLGVVAPDG